MEKASIFFKTFLFHHNRRSINRHRHSKGCRTDWPDKFSGTGRCHPHGDSHRLPVCSHTTVPRSVVSAGASGIPYSGDPAPPPCLHVPAPLHYFQGPCVHGTVVIPSGRLLMLSHAVQRISGLSVIAVSEIITGCPQSGLFFIARSLLLPACLLPEVSKSLTVAAISLASTVAASATTIGLPAISATVTVAFGPLLHDLLVGCLDFLELFFRLILIGIVDIGIGMVFPAQCLICFFISSSEASLLTPRTLYGS